MTGFALAEFVERHLHWLLQETMNVKTPGFGVDARWQRIDVDAIVITEGRELGTRAGHGLYRGSLIRERVCSGPQRAGIRDGRGATQRGDRRANAAKHNRGARTGQRAN